MSDDRSHWQQELDGLRTIRDELRVQAELGRAELRDELSKLEKRWHELEGKLKLIGDEARHDLEEVRSAAGLLAEELKEGYRHLRERFQ